MPIPDDTATLAGYFEAVEAVATEMRRKWGFDRLTALVGASNADLLARFRRQQQTWSEVYQAAWASEFLSRDRLAQVAAKAGAMQRGWQALDAHAEEQGHRPVAVWVWEARLADGSLVAIVQTDAEASSVIAEGWYAAVYTTDEVGHVIDAIPQALQLAKAAWPQAKFAASRQTANSLNAEPWDVEQGDPIPFGDQPEEDRNASVVA